MPKLRAVAADETVESAEAPKTLQDAVGMSERALMVAMRARIASEIDSGVPSHALAGLVRQLRDVDREIRAMDERRRQEGRQGDRAPDEALDASAV